DMCPLRSPRTRSVQREKRIATSVGENEATSSEFYELNIRCVFCSHLAVAASRDRPSQSAPVSRGSKKRRQAARTPNERAIFKRTPTAPRRPPRPIPHCWNKLGAHQT